MKEGGKCRCEIDKSESKGKEQREKRQEARGKKENLQK